MFCFVSDLRRFFVIFITDGSNISYLDVQKPDEILIDGHVKLPQGIPEDCPTLVDIVPPGLACMPYFFIYI